MAQKQVTWHSVSNPSIDQLGGEVEASSKRHFRPSPEKIRDMARHSTQGGTGYCAVCKQRFTMGYLRQCKISTFEIGDACMDCIKEHNLQRVK